MDEDDVAVIVEILEHVVQRKNWNRKWNMSYGAACRGIINLECVCEKNLQFRERKFRVRGFYFFAR